jgi:hypothetical protein
MMIYQGGKRMETASENANLNETSRIIREKRKRVVYLRKCLSVSKEAAVLLVIVAVGYFAMLYTFKAAWHLYLATPMGGMFDDIFPEKTEGMTYLMGLDFIRLSIWMTIYSFLITIAAALLCRFLYLTRLFRNCGLLGKALFYGLPLIILIAWFIKPRFGFQEWSSAIAVTALPALCVFGRCFNYAIKLVPELGDLIKRKTDPLEE